MQKLLKPENNSKLKIRLAQLKDLKFTFQLHNKNVLKKNFFSKKKTSFKEHKKWFKDKLNKKMLFISSNRVRIGYIRYDTIKKNNLSISIAVKENFKRSGFGKFMLQKSLKYKKIAKQNVYAFVKNDNISSKKFFLDSGFKKSKANTYILKSKRK